MKYDRARERVVRRSRVVVGRAPDDDSTIGERVAVDPRAHARLLLSGLLEPDAMDAVIDGLENATGNLMYAITQSEGEGGVAGTVYVFLAQELLFGILLGQCEPAQAAA